MANPLGVLGGVAAAGASSMMSGGQSGGGVGAGGQHTTGSVWTPEQMEAQKKLGYYLTGQVGQGVAPYAGQQVAGMSAPEQAGQNRLASYVNQGTPAAYNWAGAGIQQAMNQNYPNLVTPGQNWTAPMSGVEQQTQMKLGDFLGSAAPDEYDQAQNTLSSVLANKYENPIVDPAASQQLYERMKIQAMKDLEDLQNTQAENANLRGMYFSGKHAENQGQLLTDMSENLIDAWTNLQYQDELQRREIEREREARQFAAVPEAVALGQARTGYTQDQLRAGSEYGALPRLLEQAQLEKEREDELQGRDIAMQREERGFAAIPLAQALGEQQFNLPLQQAQAAQELGALPRELEQAGLTAAFEDFLRTQAENNPALAYALEYLTAQGVADETKEQVTKSIAGKWRLVD